MTRYPRQSADRRDQHGVEAAFAAVRWNVAWRYVAYGRRRDLGTVVTVTHQAVTELQGTFGTPAGQRPQVTMHDGIISKLG